VELVPAPPALLAPAEPERRGFRLNGRDWLLLGIGAGSVILAGVAGFVLANLVR
jgi:hypothetical protein